MFSLSVSICNITMHRPDTNNYLSTQYYIYYGNYKGGTYITYTMTIAKVILWTNKSYITYLALYAVFRTLRLFSCKGITLYHYNDVIMGEIASPITSLTIVYSTVYSDADQRKHQSSESLASVRGIHRGPVNSPHKGPVTRKMFPFDDVIMHFTTSIIQSEQSGLFQYINNIEANLSPATSMQWIMYKDFVLLQMGISWRHAYMPLKISHRNACPYLSRFFITDYKNCTSCVKLLVLHLKFCW